MPGSIAGVQFIPPPVRVLPSLPSQMGGKLIRTIGWARAGFGLTMMVACYNLKRLVYFQKAGIMAF